MIDECFGVTCVALRSGVMVANFASPHAYLFTDGTVLPAVDTHLAYARCYEEKTSSAPLITAPDGSVIATTVKHSHIISDEVARDVEHLLGVKHKDGRNAIDILIVPTGWYPAWLACGRAPSNRIRSGVKAGLKWRSDEFGVA